jgi:hypothetical protein
MDQLPVFPACCLLHSIHCSSGGPATTVQQHTFGMPASRVLWSLGSAGKFIATGWSNVSMQAWRHLCMQDCQHVHASKHAARKDQVPRYEQPCCTRISQGHVWTYHTLSQTTNKFGVDSFAIAWWWCWGWGWAGDVTLVVSTVAYVALQDIRGTSDVT